MISQYWDIAIVDAFACFILTDCFSNNVYFSVNYTAQLFPNFIVGLGGVGLLVWWGLSEGITSFVLLGWSCWINCLFVCAIELWY